MHDFWKLYEDYEATRISSEHARKHYQKVLRDLEEITGCSFFKVTTQKAYAFRNSLKRRAYSDVTRDERLRILKSIGSYFEQTLPGYRSPFTNLPFFSEITFYTGSDVPTIERVSELLSRAEDSGNLRAFLAITLALRLCLLSSEILVLKRQNFVQQEGAMFLNVPGSEIKSRTLPVPDDVVSVIERAVPGFFNQPGSASLLTKKNGQPISFRTLHNSISSLKKEGEDPVTLQDIRLLGIYLLLKNNNNREEVATFAGIGDRWMFRYEKLLNEPISSVKLPNISIHLGTEIA